MEDNQTEQWVKQLKEDGFAKAATIIEGTLLQILCNYNSGEAVKKTAEKWVVMKNGVELEEFECKIFAFACAVENAPADVVHRITTTETISSTYKVVGKR